ncbi:Gfo/Idh/MocA family protein [Sphingobacterium sp. LRF_L2]|uniref:Gfo/Idh/MocA family protein n=1 Tax=Sphingobacterium sp. LRF_L2 TaxID=3369421 RepID=UPI003F63F69A
MNRKDFIKSAAILAGSTLYFKASAFSAVRSQIKVGLIGVHGMGWANLNALLKNEDVVCTALCDVDENILGERVAELSKRGITVKTYINHQDLIKDAAIDAVIVATPDHWHCLQMVDAVKAGKHVYVEKPIGNSIKECEIMLAAEKQGNSMVQVGQWQRSQKHFSDAVDFVHSGKLGKVRLVKAWSYLGWKTPILPKPDSEVPAGVHYDRWLGPAQKRPFNSNRFHFEFRWFWDYAGGLMTDWGVHMLDYALLGMKAAEPISIMVAGGKFANPNGASETPDTMTAVYEFGDFNIQWEHSIGISQGPYDRDHGVAFIGENGTLVLNRNGWEVLPEKGKMDAVPLQKPSDNGLEKHMENFVEAIQKNDRTILNAPITAGANIAIFSQMGNIAYRTKRKLFWDTQKRKFTDKEANKYLVANYHNGYKLPTV